MTVFTVKLGKTNLNPSNFKKWRQKKNPINGFCMGCMQWEKKNYLKEQKQIDAVMMNSRVSFDWYLMTWSMQINHDLWPICKFNNTTTLANQASLIFSRKCATETMLFQLWNGVVFNAEKVGGLNLWWESNNKGVRQTERKGLGRTERGTGAQLVYSCWV